MTSSNGAEIRPAREVAHELRQAGISSIPIRSGGSKQPALTSWKEFQENIPTEEEINNMFRGSCGIAVVGGKVSGNLETMDIDAPELVEPYEALVEELSPGLISRLSVAATPRGNYGGRHYRYRVQGIVAGNTTLAQSELQPKLKKDGTPDIDERTGEQKWAPKTLIETRGEGGYSVAPGSPGLCHETGLPYKHLSGPQLTGVPIITPEEHAALWTAAAAFNRFIEDSEVQSGGKAVGHGLSPGNDYNNRATWEEILGSAGWVKDRTRGELTFWRRPGKDRGQSGTTGVKSKQAKTDLFCVFSSNAYPFTGPSGGRKCTSYSKFAAYAVLNHNSDFSAAAKALAAQGYGEKPKSKMPSGTAAIAAAKIRLPEPFVPFPVQSLPYPVSAYVLEAAQAIGCDPTLVALPMLATLAGCVGATRRIRLKHGWYAPAVLWTASVVDSGQQKSPAQGAVTMPLYQRQGRDLKEHQERLVEYQKQLAVYEQEFAEWKKLKGPSKGEPPEKPQEPPCKRIIISDSTIEAVADRLNDNNRGLLLDRDELSGWLGSYDQYRGGKGSDVSHWLSCYNAKPMLIDRKTSSRKVTYVERAAVSITGGIQPRILARLLGHQHFENGLAARFGFGMPPKRSKRWSNASVSSGTYGELEQVYDSVLALGFRPDGEGNPIPVDLPLTTNGMEAFVEFYNQHGEEQGELTGNLAALWAKLEEAAARIALIVHLVRCAVNDSSLVSQDAVDDKSVVAGIAMARWLGNEGRRIYDALAESEADRDRRQLIELIERKGGALTVRELSRCCRHYEKAELAEEALAELVRAGAGKWEAIPPPATGGHATTRFVLFDRSCADTRTVFPAENPSSASVSSERQSETEDSEEEVEWTE